MPEYRGNAVYDYVTEHHLNYYFSAEDHWILVYGDAQSIPKILVLAFRVERIATSLSADEKNTGNRAFLMAKELRLPFLFIRFMSGLDRVAVWEGRLQEWRVYSYDQLRDLYEAYGVVRPGTARKEVNQYVSSPYHDWQRQNLGRITVSDFDLLKYEGCRIQEIIELKRSKLQIEDWTPYAADYPNFALLINLIVGSGKKIPFKLYYNVMRDGPVGEREEDISQIKVFEFVIPDETIGCGEIQYRELGVYTAEELL